MMYNVTPEKAFEQAITDGHLSIERTAHNYVGNYMFMGFKDGELLFKHRNTRSYHNYTPTVKNRIELFTKDGLWYARFCNGTAKEHFENGEVPTPYFVGTPGDVVLNEISQRNPDAMVFIPLGI